MTPEETVYLLESYLNDSMVLDNVHKLNMVVEALHKFLVAQEITLYILVVLGVILLFGLILKVDR